VPAVANGRGLREAGVTPNAGPGLGLPALAGGHGAREIARRLASGELTALYLLQVDPVLHYSDAELWSAPSHGQPPSSRTPRPHARLREHATVIFPAETSPRRKARSRTGRARAAAARGRRPRR